MDHSESINSSERFTFCFMIDGMGDPGVAQSLTRDIKELLDLPARCDPAGMWLEVESEEPIDEAWTDRIIEVARLQGLELRDRVGSSFVANVSRDALRNRMQSEWRTRFATSLVFLLPALLLHYLTPYLASSSTYLPNGIELVLVGWTIVAATWPILYQGLVSATAFRMTPDLYQSFLIVMTFLIGAWQVITGSSDTMLYITSFAVISIAFQRRALWNHVDRLDGHAHLMLPFARILLIVLIAASVVSVFDRLGGVSMMLAVPAMMGALAINQLAYPTGWVIPVLMFVVWLGISPMILPDRFEMEFRVEAAFLFTILLTAACSRFAGPVQDSAESDTRNQRYGK